MTQLTEKQQCELDELKFEFDESLLEDIGLRQEEFHESVNDLREEMKDDIKELRADSKSELKEQIKELKQRWAEEER